MNRKVSLVLSGGGARGIAHIGVIEELEKQGFEIFSISGTSMGAMVGGVYALGKLEEFKKWLFTLNRIKVFNLLDFSLSTQGLVKGEKLLNTMKGFIPDAKIEDLKIAYSAVAADLLNKEEVVFTKGSVYDAIRASMAIPTVFTPVMAENRILVDGGVVNNIPISHAKRIPNDILIAVNANADIPVAKSIISKKESDNNQSIYLKKIKEFYKYLYKTNPMSHEEHLGYFNLINNTIGLMVYHQSQLSIKQYPPDILIEVSIDSCGLFDFYKAEDMVEMGRLAAIKYINDYSENNKNPVS